MSSYDLLLNQTVIGSAALGPQKEAVQPWGTNNPNSPPPEQTFHLKIVGTAGNVSGTAQVVVSNDGLDWIPYGDPIAAPSTYLTAHASFGGTQSWKYFGAYLTAIAGTGAKATLRMNA